MKKIFVLVTFLMFAGWGMAQVNIGARTGMNAGLFELKHTDLDKYDITPRYNLILNMDIDVPFSLIFSFRTGLGLVQKAAEVDRTLEMGSVDTVWSTLYRMSYLEVPLLLVARAETERAGNFYFGIGPTLSLGVGGQVKLAAESKNTNKQSEEDIKIVWDGKEGETIQHGFYHFKRFDMGLGAILAYQLPRSGLTFTLSYNKGLIDLAPNSKAEFRTSYVGLCIGFSMQN